jgi:hypothetical protein
MRSRVGSLTPTIDGYSRTSDEAYTSWNEEEQEDPIDWHVRLTPSGFRFTSNIHTFKDLISQLNCMEQILRVRRQSENPLRDNLLNIQTNASQWLGGLRSVSINIVIGHAKVDNQGDLLSRTFSTEKLIAASAYTRLHREKEREEDNMFRAAVANKQAPFTLPISLFRLMVNQLVRNFFHCHNQRFFPMFHRRSFYTIFYDSCDPLESPVVCALVAFSTALQCKHVYEILPKQEAHRIGVMAFDHARELLGDVFDREDLPTFAAYLLLGHYKLTCMDFVAPYPYFNAAGRIAESLLPRYVEQRHQLLTDGGQHERELLEMENFKRLHCHSFAFASDKRFVLHSFRVSVPQDLLIYRPTAYSLLGPPEAMDEEKLQPEFFQYAKALIDLRILAQKLYFERIANRARIPSTTITQCNTELLNWYQALPKDLQLPSALFQPIDRKGHRKRILDPAYHPFALRLISEFYAIWLGIYEQLLPSNGKALDPRAALSGVERQAIDVCFRSSCIILDLFEVTAWTHPCLVHWSYVLWAWNFLGWMVRFHGIERDNSRYRLVRSLEIGEKVKEQILENEAAGSRDSQVHMKDWDDLDRVVLEKKEVLGGQMERLFYNIGHSSMEGFICILCGGFYPAEYPTK